MPCAPGVPYALICFEANGAKHDPGALVPRECGGVFARNDGVGCLKIESELPRRRRLLGVALRQSEDFDAAGGDADRMFELRR